MYVFLFIFYLIYKYSNEYFLSVMIERQPTVIEKLYNAFAVFKFYLSDAKKLA